MGNVPECPKCDGNGWIGDALDERCPDCHGWATAKDHPPKGCAQQPCAFPRCGDDLLWSCPCKPGVDFWTGLPEVARIGEPF